MIGGVGYLRRVGEVRVVEDLQSRSSATESPVRPKANPTLPAFSAGSLITAVELADTKEEMRDSTNSRQ